MATVVKSFAIQGVDGYTVDIGQQENAGPDGTAHRTVYEELPSERGATDDTGRIGRCECFRNSLCCRIQRS